MHRPTVRQLEYAVAVADELHFRRAAEKCAVSQPALSAQVRELEDTLGIQLFERSRRQVRVTAAGVEIIDRARRLLRDLDALGEAATRSAVPLSTPIRLGVIPTVAPYLLPRVLPLLRERHRALELPLREDQTARLVESLEAGELDLLLLALPIPGGATGQSRALFEEPFFLAAPPDHPLAARTSLRQDDLGGRDLLLLEDGHCLREHALAVCSAAGAHASSELRATSLNTLVHMVASGLGITLLPEMAVDAAMAAEARVAVVPFAGAPPTRTIGLLWRQSSARSAEYQVLGDLIIEAWTTRGPSPGAGSP